jgi:WD40 repeat protein/serine/threonine protein kinase
MKQCHACQHVLDQSAVTAGQCPHCGAILRKLSQRTIDDKHLLRDSDKDALEQRATQPDLTSGGSPSEESLDLEITDTGRAGATIQMSQSDTADENGGEDAGSAPEKKSDPERRSPTIADRSDLTVMFGMPPNVTQEDPERKRAKRSTHTLESDRTVDLDPSSPDARQIDSQWRGTFDREAKQGQTIRQKETVTGFRSSLPVKSRYVREKRKDGGPSPAPRNLGEVPDYELLDIIGEGGMGVVYAAHQSSIARTVAVKMLKPSAKIREDQRDKFISEAVVTGELDHPNIVPIYDLGANDEGALFYSMKRVRGTPWDKVIHQKQLDENLSILLRVADAVAFAHAGGVIHRDLKPENVMLGDFGEVLVMDWGLARITPEFAHVDQVFQPDSLGGTPAYMAPEMARGPVENINKTSDIYLLGAILYEIIGGQPPHSGRDVMQCLMAASQNRIDPIRYDGELKALALKAMATRQEDRYQTVKEFQEAIRTYQSHSESLVLTAHANQNLQKARTSQDYQPFARALYGFQESLTLWSGNQRARDLLTETQRDYATCALEKGDFDLAASLLDTSHEEHQALMKRIDAARTERDARQRRLRRAKQAVMGLTAAVVAIISAALFFVDQQRARAVVAEKEAVTQQKEAVKQRDIAVVAQTEEAQQRKEAEEQRGIAEQKRVEADEQRGRAEEQTKIAVEQRSRAEAAKQAEEYEAYVARIGLAAAKIDENAFDFAYTLLQDSKPELRNWEWGRLVHLTQLGAAAYKAEGPIEAVAYAPDGKTFATGDRAGKVTVRDARSGKVAFAIPHGQNVLSVAYSPDGRWIASGSSDKTIKIIDAASGKELVTLPSGHTDGVLSVRFSPDGRQLLSGALDNTARLWDLSTRQTVQEFRGHSWWVWAAEFSPDGRRIVTAGQDGKAVVWEKRGAGSGEQGARDTQIYVRLTEFTGHDGAVYSAKFSPDGKLIATGGYDKRVMIWNPDAVRPIDIERRLKGEPDPPSNHIILTGHDGPVRSVAFSPNGQLAISASEDNTIRVWDATAGKAEKTLRGHGSPVRACAFSPDGQTVLSGGDDQSIRKWDVKGYQEVRVLHANVFTGHEDAVLAARFSRDGRQIVTASRDRTAALWDAASGKPLRRFAEGHDFLVSGAAFLPDGNHLVTGAGDNTVRIWDQAFGTQRLVLSETGRIGTLAVSTDGKWIATGSPGTDAKIWDRETGKLAATLSGHTKEVSALTFSKSGDRLASGDDDGVVRIWQRGHGVDSAWVVEHEFSGHNGSITGLRFTPDGSRLITASGDHTCGQWDVASGEELRQLTLSHPEWISALDLSPDGTLALTTCDDRVARLWRIADAAQIAAVESPGKAFNSAGFSPDGSTAVLSSSEDKRVWRWDLSAAQGAASPATADQLGPPLLDFNSLGGEVWAAMFAPDGRHVLTIGGNDAQLWHIESRRAVVRYSPHGAVASAAVSPDGRLVATGSWDHSAKIWDAATGDAIRRLDGGHIGYINSVEFSPDGRELLTASDDGTARVWDVESGKPTEVVLRGHTARLLSATYSPDASRILTVSGDKTARIWDRATGRLIHTLEGHKWAVLSGQFSPDGKGKYVITGSQDETAKIWDSESGEELLTLQGHTAAITSVAISPDGERALTGSQDYTAKLWDAATGKEILSLPGHTQDVTSVSFSPDNRSVLTSSRDGTAIIWLATDWRDSNSLQTAR